MKEIKLFDYQEDMKSRIEKALRLHQSVMAQMPTGTGKTYLLTAVIDSFVKANPNMKVWIIAHRIELVSQIEETIKKFYSYSASENDSLLVSVKAMSIQWLSRHYDEIEEEPGMIVIEHIKRCGRYSRKLSSWGWQLHLADWTARDLWTCLTCWCSRGAFLSLSVREYWRHTISLVSERGWLVLYKEYTGTKAQGIKTMGNCGRRQHLCH